MVSIVEVEESPGQKTDASRAGITRFGSSSSLIFEFGDDEKNEKKLAELADKYFYLQHEATYSIKVFIEFFIYHLLWYLFFGYFLTLVAIFFKKYRLLSNNMGFFKFRNKIIGFQIAI